MEILPLDVTLEWHDTRALGDIGLTIPPFEFL